MFVCLLVCVFASLFACLRVCQFVCLFVCLFACVLPAGVRACMCVCLCAFALNRIDLLVALTMKNTVVFFFVVFGVAKTIDNSNMDELK